jgi:SH3 domain protein
MKKRVVIGLAVFVFTVIISSPVLAKIMYVGDITKLNVRSERSVTSDILGTIPSAREVNVITFTSGWTNVRLPDGTEGWVNARYLTSDKPASLIISELNEQLEIIGEQLETLQIENNHLQMDPLKLLLYFLLLWRLKVFRF